MVGQQVDSYPFKKQWLVDTTRAFHYHWLVWRFTGVAKCTSEGRLRRWLYYGNAVFINAVVTVLFPLTLIVNVFHSSTLKQLYESLTITLTDLTATFKFVNVFVEREKLYAVEAILSNSLDHRSAGSEEEFVLLRDAVAKARNTFRIFWGLYTVGTTISLFRVGLAQRRTVLFPAWFYLDWQSSDVAYAIVLGYQLFGIIVQAVQDCANDSYPPAYLSVLTGHMQALQVRIARIGRHNNRQHFAYKPAQLERNYRQLINCIEDHLNILKLHALIQQTLSVSCLVQFVGTALVQCTVSFQFLYALSEHDLSSQMISIIFFGAVTLEALIICYFSDQMREQSIAVSDAFYACNWIPQLPKFKQNLVFTIMRTQKPCGIFAGNYFSVDLNTFVVLMKFTYSVFTLLTRFR